LITLQRRHPSVPVLLFPVLVQGTGAALSIVRAIETMNRLAEVDVLIVGRGGGSLEELWAFNEEAVARSIAASAIPVISAVGHETDYTIADFVADLRAATPTAAAELAVPNVVELQAHLAHMRSRLVQSLKASVQSRKERLARLRRSPLFANPRKVLLQHAERLDRLKDRLEQRTLRKSERSRERLLRLQAALQAVHPGEKAASEGKRLTTAVHRLQSSMTAGMKERKLSLVSLIRQLDALSPLKVMSRGYSLVYDESEKQLIKSIGQVQPGDIVKVRLSDGRLDCHVWGMKGDT
jgi:exodeoxyribonuclease VII large subunit